ncbi:hypothetical protein FHD67_06535 [Paracoccus haeundaensis]|uniref:Uncharacterized protein n=1 Tax=Paracoccus haeundaensis TaxID=225362 RepID=A0A5C4R986_9RHOB|nr:hypothetical protein FHD67_06535 [Paracoccus haeundaensis]
MAVQDAKRVGTALFLIGDAAVADLADGAAVDAVADAQRQHATVGQADQCPACPARADRADDLGAAQLDAVLDSGAGGGIADGVLRDGGHDLGLAVDLGRAVLLVARCGGLRLGLGLGAGTGFGLGAGLGFGPGVGCGL